MSLCALGLENSQGHQFLKLYYAVVARQELRWHLLYQLRDNNSIYTFLQQDESGKLSKPLNYVFDYFLYIIHYKYDKFW